jgi:hypothetical protein
VVVVVACRSVAISIIGGAATVVLTSNTSCEGSR